jgi:5'-3' exonuclease
MKKVMIIDGLNMFLRSYIVVPSMDKQGSPNGGSYGFMKSLQKISGMFQPDEVIVCWDGEGGSQKRKQIDKNYKAGRKPVRFNRRLIDLSPEESDKNKYNQQYRLMEYLNDLPIIQTMIDYIEADDVIAYVAQHEKYQDWEKVIVSSDKDFFQLISEDCKLYRPIQDQLVDYPTLMKEHKIHPKNFALARSLVGDKSDNLPGVPRVGLKTVAGKFPFLADEHQYEVEDIMQHCEGAAKMLKVHENILENSLLVEKNYKIMQLYSPSIGNLHKKQINFSLKEFDPNLEKLELTKKLYSDGINASSFNVLMNVMKKITLQK